MGTVRVRMERIYWLHYLKSAPMQQTGLQPIRMRLDPLKKRLILEEDLGESCFRFFLPVNMFDAQENSKDSTYFVYLHQLYQVLKKMEQQNKSGMIKLEFRINTLTFHGVEKRPEIIPMELKHEEETTKIKNHTAFASGQWMVTPEFIKSLKNFNNPAIPFRIQNQSLHLLEETLNVYTDGEFLGSFPREPFLKFVQIFQLPACINIQISENETIRLQCSELDISVETEIRLNQQTNVYLPAKSKEISTKSLQDSMQNQNQRLTSYAVSIVMKKLASLLNQPFPLQADLHVRFEEGKLEWFAGNGPVFVRAVLPLAKNVKPYKKFEGWIKAQDVTALCEWLEAHESSSSEFIEMTSQALTFGSQTIAILAPDVQIMDYREQQNNLLDIYNVLQTVEKADPEEYIHLLFGKVKDFSKHIGQVQGDTFHINSKDGIVNIGVDYQSIRTRKMSKRMAKGNYAMHLQYISNITKAFDDNREVDATIRFTGIYDMYSWFTVYTREMHYDIWIPLLPFQEQPDEYESADEMTESTAAESDVSNLVALADMEDWVGLDELKQQITRIVNYVAFERQRQKIMQIKETLPSLHMCFTGNPGTGKTMTARLVGRLYKQIGVLEKGHVVEVDRQKLVGQHVGHSEANLSKYIQQALGGVLFIDEAHALYKAESGKDYGHDIIHVLVKAME